MAKKRFRWFRTEHLNPETLEDDLPWWAVQDNVTRKWISEHDNANSAKKLCRLLNELVELESTASKHHYTDFTSNDEEIDSSIEVIEYAKDILSAVYPEKQ